MHKLHFSNSPRCMPIKLEKAWSGSLAVCRMLAYIAKPGGEWGGVFWEWMSSINTLTHAYAPSSTGLKHPKVRCSYRKLWVVLWRATASHILAHTHRTDRSGPDRKSDLLVLHPRAAHSANHTPFPTRLNSFLKFTLIKVRARRAFAVHLIQDLHFRDERTEAQ